MKRLFIGLGVPEQVQQDLRKMRLPSMDLKKQHGLHITLHFLGQTTEEKQEILIDLLSKIKQKAFNVRVKGAGAFTSGSIPICLWAGVENTEGLANLHRDIGDSLVKLNMKFESRTYKPHITVSRLYKANGKRANQKIAEQFKLDNASFSAQFKATSFVLYCSEIIKNKPQYTSLASFELY